MTRRPATALGEPSIPGTVPPAGPPDAKQPGLPVDLRSVTKVFSDVDPPLAALGPVDMSIPRGGFAAVVGPSGSGKSTLLRIVAGLVTPTSGDVRLGDETPSEARARRDYGIVFQAPVLYPWRSVAENVALPLRIAGLPPREVTQRVRDVLAGVGMQDFADSHPRQLSGGMQQRAAIARAIVTRPRLLLMDEPFGALDEITRQKMNSELLELWHGSGMTVLFVTHSIDEAVFLADHVVVLSPRPGTVMLRTDIDLPRPRPERVRASRDFVRLSARVRDALAGTAIEPPETLDAPTGTVLD